MTAVDVSPDGTQVVYSTCAYPTDPEFTYTPSTRHGTDADGNPVIFITSVSPNPELLNYDHEIVRAQIDGTQPQRLTNNAYFDNYPAWSPDGAHIAFVTDSGISIMATDGSGVRSLSAGVAGVAWQPPAWSPDGQHLAFTGTKGQTPSAIYTVGLNQSPPKRLTAAVSGGSWSPDSQRLAFAKPDGAEVALFTIAADGSDVQRVTTIMGRQPRDGGAGPNPQGDRDRGLVARRLKDPVFLQWWNLRGQVGWHSGARGASARGRGRLVAGWVAHHANSSVAERFKRGGERQSIAVYTMAPDGSDLRPRVLRSASGELQTIAPRRLGGQVDVAGCAAGIAVPEPTDNPGLVQDCETLLGSRDALAYERLNWNPSRSLREWGRRGARRVPTAGHRTQPERAECHA